MENLTLISFENCLACAMCLGGAEGEIAVAANVAIGLMLVFLFMVLGSFLYFIFYLARKAKLVAAEDLEMKSAMTD